MTDKSERRKNFAYEKIGATILIFISLDLLGQQVKQIITTYSKSEYVKEVYYVLKSNKGIKHGEYYSFYKGELARKELKTKNLRNDILGFKEKGQYENDLKEGDWIYFRPPRRNSSTFVYNDKIEEGRYTKDKKTGIWKTYIEDGKVTKLFDFGSNIELTPIVRTGWKYPAEARRNGVEGTVTIKVTYINCEPLTYEILKDIGYGCGNAAIESLNERRQLEKKYGVASTKCGTNDEVLDCRFELHK
jgi:hypothetical protein